MRREPYRCIYCEQVSSRRWNMAIHIQRRHNGLENPFKLPSNLHSGVARVGTLNGGTHPWSNSHHKLSEYAHEDLAKGFNLSKRAMTPRKKDPQDSLTEEIQEALKNVNIINQARSISQSSAPDLTPLLKSLISSQTFDPNVLLYLASLGNKKNIAFRGNICDNCLTYWIEPLSNNEEEMKSLIYTKPQPHKCTSKNLVEAKKVHDARIKKNELENNLIKDLQLFTNVCANLQDKKLFLETKELIYSPNYFMDRLISQSINDFHDNNDQKPYLRCWVEGEQVNCNSVHINLTAMDEKYWANRAIYECVKSGQSSFELNNNEFVDFLKVTKGTLGVLTTPNVDGSIRYFFMYISFGAKYP
jgi:hypothetical protein